MKLRSQIVKEISDRIVEYKAMQAKPAYNEMDGWRELESAIHELEHLLEWINE
jgi:adenylosuccinate synthase